MSKYGRRELTSKLDAFNQLGYKVDGVRGTWSKDSDDKKRVLVTLWDLQIRDFNGGLSVDLDEEHPRGLSSIGLSPARHARHMKRAQRLRKAMTGQASLDVVVLFGPLDNPEKAMPWRNDEQFDREWRVISVRDDDGFFRVEAK